MQSVLIIGSSGGIGSALTAAYTVQGASVTGLSRRDDGLDVTDPPAVDAALADMGPFDRVIVTTGALEIDKATPEKTIRAVDAKAMAAQFALNAIGPALILRRAHHLLPRDRQSVFAVLSARVGSIGDNRLGGWISYRSAKAALNQIIRTSAIELGRSHPHSTVVALHPGTVATPFTEKYLGRHPAVSPDEAAANLTRVIEGLKPEDTGNFYDWKGEAVPW